MTLTFFLLLGLVVGINVLDWLYGLPDALTARLAGVRRIDLILWVMLATLGLMGGRWLAPVMPPWLALYGMLLPSLVCGFCIGKARGDATRHTTHERLLLVTVVVTWLVWVVPHWAVVPTVFFVGGASGYVLGFRWACRGWDFSRDNW